MDAYVFSMKTKGGTSDPGLASEPLPLASGTTSSVSIGNTPEVQLAD